MQSNRTVMNYGRKSERGVLTQVDDPRSRETTKQTDLKKHLFFLSSAFVNSVLNIKSEYLYKCGVHRMFKVKSFRGWPLLYSSPREKRCGDFVFVLLLQQ